MYICYRGGKPQLYVGDIEFAYLRLDNLTCTEVDRLDKCSYVVTRRACLDNRIFGVKCGQYIGKFTAYATTMQITK
jgi:hypothetical protein